MAQNNKECKTCFLDIVGGLLLAICSISLIIALVVVFKKTPEKPIVNAVSLTIQADSTGALAPTSQHAIDSLTTLVRQQDIEIRERYAYFIEQKERENALITFGGIIISIILGIFGFFGYKSFKAIEDKALSNAEEKVRTKVTAEFEAVKNEIEEKAKGTINERFKVEYTTKLGIEVSNQMSENFEELLRSRSGSLDNQEKSVKDLQERVNKVESFINHLKDNGLTFRPDFTDDSDSSVGEFAGERKMRKAAQTDKEEGGEQ